MAIEVRERDENGNLLPPVKKFEGLTDKEQIEFLGLQLAQEKLANMEKDCIINGLGMQVAQMKFEIMQLKGGVS